MTDPLQEVKAILKTAIPGPSWVVDELLKPLKKARPIDEWHEDYGDVLWWKFPICEPPYVGDPRDIDWPDYHTHWTPIVVPDKEEEAK
ncbi:hypothetical protein D3C74_312100 [compost metagenome]